MKEAYYLITVRGDQAHIYNLTGGDNRSQSSLLKTWATRNSEERQWDGISGSFPCLAVSAQVAHCKVLSSMVGG